MPQQTTAPDGLAGNGELPTPATASSVKRRTPLVRISQTPLRVRWARIKQKFGTASAPSESVVEGSTTEASSHGLQVATTDDQLVDIVVVDREFHLTGTDTAESMTASRNSRDKSVTGSVGVGVGGGGGAAMGRNATTASYGTHASKLSKLVPWAVVERIHRFFDLGSELQPDVERQFRKEQWHLSKRLALIAAVFFVLNWILGVAFVPRPLTLPDKIVYWGVFSVLSIPLPFLIAYDYPRDHNIIYQVYLSFCVWSWATYMAIYINLCDYYHNTHQVVSCNGKDFIGLFFFTTALQTMGMFALHQNRTAGVISATAFFVVLAVAVVPLKATILRQAINFIVYEVFVIYAHYKKESSDRRLFHLREELKNQYRATQKAQIAERKAGDSKRRLTSYIFHEVRVPLNTAMLATQNMEASGAVPKEHEIEFRALQGSLGMMSKVLNDVLDFNRMDAGRFESVSRPYALHTALRSMFSPLKLAAESKGIDAHLDLDPRVDEVARDAAAQMRLSEDPNADDDLEKDGERGEEEAGIVIGDEMRLRQIVTNLASNATKFTPAGGRIELVTRLVHPAPGATLDPLPEDPERPMHQRMVVRIEVRDTGVGIRASDLSDSGRRLFSPYVQTEIGRVQGGKGSGLGLALVRHIVRLSHGRLGVRSRVGEGSTFWIELALGIGVRADAVAGPGGVMARSDTTGGHSHSEGSGGVLYASTRRVDGVAHLTSGVAEFERAMVARRPDPVLDEPPRPGAALGKRSSRRSAHRRNSYQSRVQRDGAPSPMLIMSNGVANSPHTSLPPSPTEEQHPLQTISSTPPPMSLGSLPPPATVESPPLHDLTPTASYAPDYNFTPLPAPRGKSSALPTPDSMPTASTGGSPGPSPFVPTTPPGSATAPPPTPYSPTDLIQGTASGMGQDVENDRRMRILVVDDDGLTRRLMGRALARMGCVVDTAEHGRKALDMILEQSKDDYSEPYNVIFLDNQMHIMSGIEMVSHLRSLGRRDFVVGVTGNALLSDQEEYLTAGVDHVLIKPVVEHALRSMLVAAQERRRNSRRKSERIDELDKEEPDPLLASGPAPVSTSTHEPLGLAPPDGQNDEDIKS